MDTIDLSNWREKDNKKLLSIEYTLTGRPGPSVEGWWINVYLYTSSESKVLKVIVCHICFNHFTWLTDQLPVRDQHQSGSSCTHRSLLKQCPFSPSCHPICSLCLWWLCCPPPPVTFYFSLKNQFNDCLFREALSDFPRQTWVLLLLGSFGTRHVSRTAVVTWSWLFTCLLPTWPEAPEEHIHWQQCIKWPQNRSIWGHSVKRQRMVPITIALDFTAQQCTIAWVGEHRVIRFSRHIFDNYP